VGSDFQQLKPQLPRPNAREVSWHGLHGAATSLAIAEALNATEQSVCIVARSGAEAEQLIRELDYFCADRPLLRFPDYETLPYEAISPPKDLLAERLAALYVLANGTRTALVVNAEALLGRLPPVDFIVSHSLELAIGQTLDRDELTESLVRHGYMRVSQVTEPGEIAIRGALTDIFPPGSAKPVRIDLFDNEIESLRFFDPDTQISDSETQRISIYPAREFPFDPDAIRQFRQRFREYFPIEPGKSSVYRAISDALLPAGIEYYLPLFFDGTCTLLDYLPADAILILAEDALDGLRSGWNLIEERHEQLEGDAERPLLAPIDGFFTPDEIQSSMERFGTVRISAREQTANAQHFATAHPLGPGVSADIDRIKRWIDSNERTLVLATSAGRREVLLELLRGRSYQPASTSSWQAFLAGDARVAVGVGEIEHGLRLPEQGLRVVTAEQLGLERPRQQTRRRKSAKDSAAIIREMTDLRVGAPVVHEDHGIGRYQGLKSLEVDGTSCEFLLLEYAGGDKLYVPVQSLHLVTRYTGASPDQAPLHRLGSDQWNNAKKKAALKVRDVAAELLNIYAQRAARKGTQIEPDVDGYSAFSDQFPFEETDDQARAIEDLVTDLGSGRPMDRIVCGDVGFGKTEVALRAAYVAAQDGFQVAVLVPTTLLAQQHFQTFSDRFADWPITVEHLSRFRSQKESNEILSRLSDGRLDIVIGTHRLLRVGLDFKNLGLVIIDEEHRFGVKDKEQLKRFRTNVHVLTMTATPIPRTLNMTLGGLRDLSIIATPPADRLAVRTFVAEWSDQGIREAVLREIRRGGQIYFVHNKVENIENIATQIRALVPEAEVRVAHGQMSERSLEAVMLDFYHRRFSVLLCTTIIESGIDIPTANTIIINRADRLGLAQMHQLRGRVGRSHHQAYAYLIAPPKRDLTDDAAKRLEAIAALEELGSGFALATHDLEIRGAGELLGEGQSGQIQAIGFTLYNDLLSRAVAALRDGREPGLEDPFHHGPEIDTGLPALIPEDYMPDVHLRLVQYKRIANAETQEELDNLQVELINRFGLLETATKHLFEITWLKLLASQIDVKKIQAGAESGLIVFSDKARVDPVALIRLIADHPERYRLQGQYRLRITWQVPARDEERVPRLESLLRQLGATDAESKAA
jgi:transcription-repair coupling factor (superfamily II helicase)